MPQQNDPNQPRRRDMDDDAIEKDRSLEENDESTIDRNRDQDADNEANRGTQSGSSNS
jgi:hypothetical protein